PDSPAGARSARALRAHRRSGGRKVARRLANRGRPRDHAPRLGRGARRRVRPGAAVSTRADVVVVGAGPYGLSAAAHLRAGGLQTLVFGEPMSFWRRHMPGGMLLRSSPTASSIADPDRR